MRGRAPHTGRFETRADLEAQVWQMYRDHPTKTVDIAARCRVSKAVVCDILKRTAPPSPREERKRNALIAMRNNATVIAFALKEDVINNDGKVDTISLYAITHELLAQLDEYTRL